MSVSAASASRAPSRLVPALVLALTFALGALAGIGAAPLLRPPPRPGGMPPGMESLALRPEQQRRIAAIVDAHGPEVEAALGDALPRLRVVQDRVAAEIEEVLDADQRAAFRAQRASRRPPAPVPRP